MSYEAGFFSVRECRIEVVRGKILGKFTVLGVLEHSTRWILGSFKLRIGFLIVETPMNSGMVG